jgi:homoserine kinase
MRVRVSASTSNLGPGFDVLGLAIDLWLELRARRAEDGSGVRSVRRTSLAQDWPDADDLTVRAFELAWSRLGGEGPVELEADSRIPVSRGLGSSGAAIAAGLLLAEALAPRPATREQLLDWALELEGHPDNVTPALFGGCAMTARRPGGAPRVVPVPLDPSLGFAVAWPEATLETAFARSLLPREVPHATAVESARRLALVLEGLRSGDGELLAAGNEDALHVPYRLPHIPGGAPALTAAREAGAYLATVSGSGTALFAVGRRDLAPTLAQAMRDALERAGQRASAHAVVRVPGPPRVEALVSGPVQPRGA